MCANRLVAPIEIADRAVLAKIEHDVMRVDVVETAVEEALDTLRPSGAELADRRRAFEAELAPARKGNQALRAGDRGRRSALVGGEPLPPVLPSVDMQATAVDLALA